MLPGTEPTLEDPSGSQQFVFLDRLKKQFGELDYHEFIRQVQEPTLLVVHREREGGPSDILDPADKGVQLLTISIKSTAILKYLGKAAFVTKRPGNPFAHLISVGRSARNDITIAVDSVSKVHGYFVPEGESWCFTDHGSTNGSSLDGEELDSGRKYPLKNGQILQLGLEVMLEFLTPEGLYQKLSK